MDKNCGNCLFGGKEPCSSCCAELSGFPYWTATAMVDRMNEILRAEREGRLVILPCGENAELTRDGKTYKGDHWNHSLTAFRDDPTTPSGKQVALFSIDEAEKALEEANEKNNTVP